MNLVSDADPAPAATTDPAAVVAADPVVPARCWHWVALAAILLLATALRIHGIGLNSLWIDEFFSVETSAGHCFQSIALPGNTLLVDPPRLATPDPDVPAWRIWTTLNQDQHPPLYFVLLRLWRDAFGSSESALRSLSLIFSVASIAVLFDLARHLFNPAAALWACLIMALSQQQIWYAQEARSYAMMVAALLAAAAAVVRIERRGFTLPRAAALAVGLLVAMLSHYVAAPACAAIAIYVLLRLRGPRLRQTLLTLAVAAAIYTAAWGPFLLKQTRGHAAGATAWIADDEPGNFTARWLDRLSLVPPRLIAPPSPSSAAPARMMWALLLIPALLVYRRPAFALPLLLAASAIALPAASDWVARSARLEHERYYLAAAPALILLAAGLLADRRGLLRHALPASLALYCALSLPWTYVQHKPDWRSLGAWISRDVGTDDTLLFHSPKSPWYARLAYIAADYYAPARAKRILFLDSAATLESLSPTGQPPPTRLFAFSNDSPADLTASLPTVYAITNSRFALFAGYFYSVRRTPDENTP